MHFSMGFSAPKICLDDSAGIQLVAVQAGAKQDDAALTAAQVIAVIGKMKTAPKPQACTGSAKAKTCQCGTAIQKLYLVAFTQLLGLGYRQFPRPGAVEPEKYQQRQEQQDENTGVKHPAIASYLKSMLLADMRKQAL